MLAGQRRHKFVAWLHTATLCVAIASIIAACSVGLAEDRAPTPACASDFQYTQQVRDAGPWSALDILPLDPPAPSAAATQAEIDHFWSRLSQGGQESRCGWLKDKYGVSWQIVPSVLPQMMTSADGATADRVMNAVLKMKKFDLDALNRAYAGRG